MFVNELRKQKALFAIADAIALLLSFVSALAIHDPSDTMRERLLDSNPLALFLGVLFLLATWIAIFRAFELYRRRGGGLAEAITLIQANAIGTMLAIGMGFLLHLKLSRIAMGLVLPLSTAYVIALRHLLRDAVRRVYAGEHIATPLVIVGFNRLGRYLCDQILEEPSHYVLLGFLDDCARGAPESASDDADNYRGLRLLGAPEQIKTLAAEHSCLEALIAIPDAAIERQLAAIRLCRSRRVRWSIVPWPFESVPTNVRVDLMGLVPVLGPRGSNIEGLNYFVKRSFDLMLGSLLLLAALPVMTFAAIAIWLDDGRPILFRQARVGIRGRVFNILKFRTMSSGAPDQAHREFVREWIRSSATKQARKGGGPPSVFKLAEDRRITRAGRWLRRFSIDELPQLVNVVRGEMSLIGPRPALPYELEHYEPEHLRRLDAPPGLTGLWQVSGRSHLSFEEMVRLDLQYQENWSLATDLKILLRTMPELLRGGGL